MSYIDIHHKKLFRLFYNKKIAVIGNARSLYNSTNSPGGYGNLIDTNDIVIRFNLGVDHKNTITHGSKTDWVVYNNDHWANSVDLFAYKENVNWMQIYLNEHSTVDQSVYTIPNFVLQRLFDLGKFEKNANPSIGLAFIWFLTYVKPKQVNIFGFDFKQTHTFYNYARKRKKDERKKGHNWDKEKKFFLEQILPLRNNFNYYQS